MNSVLRCRVRTSLLVAAKNGAILAGEKGPVVRLRDEPGLVPELWLVALRQPTTIHAAPGSLREHCDLLRGGHESQAPDRNIET
jgi:hypothetical protein